jgi:hypothetical protein
VAQARIDLSPYCDAAHIACGRCVMAIFLLGRMKNHQLTTKDHQLLPSLSAFLRQATDQGLGIALTRENWRAYARGRKAPS